MYFYHGNGKQPQPLPKNSRLEVPQSKKGTIPFRVGQAKRKPLFFRSVCVYVTVMRNRANCVLYLNGGPTIKVRVLFVLRNLSETGYRYILTVTQKPTSL